MFGRDRLAPSAWFWLFSHPPVFTGKSSVLARPSNSFSGHLTREWQTSSSHCLRKVITTVVITSVLDIGTVLFIMREQRLKNGRHATISPNIKESMMAS